MLASKAQPDTANKPAPGTSTSKSSGPVSAKWLALALIPALVVVGLLLSKPSGSGAPPAQAALPAAALPAADAEASLNADLGRALEHKATTGSFRGFGPTAPAASATGKDVLVLVLPTNEGCFYAGVAPGVETPVTLDKTGEKCSLGTLPSLQAELDSNDAALDSASSAAASSRLSASASTVQYWASRGDLSSLIGQSVGDGVVVSGPALGGEAVVLVTTVSEGSCMSVTVSSTGYTEPAPHEC
jgi:hypothetical protein